MAPAKQVKVIKEFQKQSAQLDMTVTFILVLFILLMQVSCINSRLNTLKFLNKPFLYYLFLDFFVGANVC